MLVMISPMSGPRLAGLGRARVDVGEEDEQVVVEVRLLLREQLPRPQRARGGQPADEESSCVHRPLGRQLAIASEFHAHHSIPIAARK